MVDNLLMSSPAQATQNTGESRASSTQVTIHTHNSTDTDTKKIRG